jgi:hypothetical protein
VTRKLSVSFVLRAPLHTGTTISGWLRLVDDKDMCVTSQNPKDTGMSHRMQQNGGAPSPEKFYCCLQ